MADANPAAPPPTIATSIIEGFTLQDKNLPKRGGYHGQAEYEQMQWMQPKIMVEKPQAIKTEVLRMPEHQPGSGKCKTDCQQYKAQQVLHGRRIYAAPR